LERQS